jgi:hypothetical protein
MISCGCMCAKYYLLLRVPARPIDLQGTFQPYYPPAFSVSVIGTAWGFLGPRTGTRSIL